MAAPGLVGWLGNVVAVARPIVYKVIQLSDLTIGGILIKMAILRALLRLLVPDHRLVGLFGAEANETTTRQAK